MDFTPFLEIIRHLATEDIDYRRAWQMNKLLNEIEETLAWQRLFLK